MLRHYFYPAAIAATIVFGVAGPVAATTITFDNFDHRGSDAIDYTITVDDTSVAGSYKITVTIDAASPNVGDIRGVGFDSAYAIAAVDIVGADITGKCANALSCGGGNGLSGGGTTAFDWLLDIGAAGSSGEFFTMTMFNVPTNDPLGCDTFTRFGVRAQTVGPPPSGGGGSSKDVSASCTLGGNGGGGGTTTTAPEPGTLLLAAAGLVGLTVRRPRRGRG